MKTGEGSLNLDDFSDTSGFVEDTEKKLQCGRHIGHLVDEKLLKMCLRCSATERFGVGVVAVTWLRQQCIHEWDSMVGKCALCWAAPRGAR